MPDIVENIYKTIAKCMPYTLTFHQTFCLCFLTIQKQRQESATLETVKSFLASTEKLLLWVPSAAPQQQLYQTVPSELQPFTFYLIDNKLLVRFFAVKNDICHHKLEWNNLLCENVAIHNLPNLAVKD